VGSAATGVGCVSRVKITSSAPTLVLIGASQTLTYQITAEATDNFGNVQSDVELYYNIVAGNDVATVSDSGLVTATASGQAVVQVSAAAFGNTVNLFTPNGVPLNAVYAEQTVSVVPGVPITPDFSFTLSSSSIDIDSTGTATLTVTQTALHGFNGTVTYRISGPYFNGGLSQAGTILWNPTSLQITGSGSGVIVFNATDAPAGSVAFYVWGVANPEATNTGDAFGDSVKGLTHSLPATLVVG
jgi:hypothetical protein